MTTTTTEPQKTKTRLERALDIPGMIHVFEAYYALIGYRSFNNPEPDRWLTTEAPRSSIMKVLASARIGGVALSNLEWDKLLREYVDTKRAKVT